MTRETCSLGLDPQRRRATRAGRDAQPGARARTGRSRRYKSVEEIEAKKLAEGLATGLLSVLAARGLVPEDVQVEAIRRCRDPETLKKWLARAAVADSLAGLFD